MYTILINSLVTFTSATSMLRRQIILQACNLIHMHLLSFVTDNSYRAAVYVNIKIQIRFLLLNTHSRLCIPNKMLHNK